jgi:putative transcriptional regulator
METIAVCPHQRKEEGGTFMANLRTSLALAAVVGLWMAGMAAGQSTSASDLGVGKMLVSSRGLADPNFAESVVLLLQYDQHGALGLMINRRTEAPLSRVLKDMDTGKRGSDPIYLGGPVELDTVFALLRSPKKPDDAQSVLDGVYLVSAKPPLEKALAASSGAGDLRVYLGYCGWDGGQLEHEVRLGGWWIFDARADEVFDPHPDSVWSRLISRTEQEIVDSGLSTGGGTPALAALNVP